MNDTLASMVETIQNAAPGLYARYGRSPAARSAQSAAAAIAAMPSLHVLFDEAMPELAVWAAHGLALMMRSEPPQTRVLSGAHALIAGPVEVPELVLRRNEHVIIGGQLSVGALIVEQGSWLVVGGALTATAARIEAPMLVTSTASVGAIKIGPFGEPLAAGPFSAQIVDSSEDFGFAPGALELSPAGRDYDNEESILRTVQTRLGELVVPEVLTSRWLAPLDWAQLLARAGARAPVFLR